MFNQLSQFDPLSPGGASVPGFPVGEDQRAPNFVADEPHTFSPALIAVARFSLLRNKFLFGEHEDHQAPSSIGFQYDPSLNVAAGPPFIQVNGYSTICDPITARFDHSIRSLRSIVRFFKTLVIITRIEDIMVYELPE